MGAREVLRELHSKLAEVEARRERYAHLANLARQEEESLRIVIAMFQGKGAELEAQGGANFGGHAELTVAPRVLAEPSAPTSPLVEPIEQVLREANGPLHLKKIGEELQKRNITVPGTNPTNNLSAVFSRNKDRFENVGRGLWKLKASPPVQLEQQTTDSTADNTTPRRTVPEPDDEPWNFPLAMTLEDEARFRPDERFDVEPEDILLERAS